MSEVIERESGWLSKVPVELHGHRKKLNYFIQSLEEYSELNKKKQTDVRVLEVGCSNGRNISLPLSDIGYHVTGIDLHEPSIEWAKNNCASTNAHFICEDFYQFKTDEKFDAVILSDILEHVADPLTVMRQSAELVNATGIILICIPNGYGPYELEQKILRVTGMTRLLDWMKRFIKRVMGRSPGKQKEYNHESGHVQFFRQKNIQVMAEAIGYKISDIKNGCLYGGDLSYVSGMVLPFIVKPSLWLADKLPSRMVSTWYFTLRK